MPKIVGIRFSPQGKVYDFDVGHFVLSPGSRVIVETQQGLALGTVVTPPRPAGDRQSKSPLKKVYRLANDEDVNQHRKNLELAKAAQAYCLECIKKLGLGMNLVSVESLLDGTKLIFYYTADGRVDFRDFALMGRSWSGDDPATDISPIERRDGPTSLVLTRQGLPHQDRNKDQLASIARGGYVLRDCDGEPQILLIATGSEVSVAMAARERLEADGIGTRVVSMPCMDLFAAQDGV